jgi:DNA-binding response OmpR family regulator
MSKQSVLIVEDEPAIAESLAYLLEREGFQATMALTLQEARHRAAAAQLIVLDLTLPDGSGHGLIVEQRRLGSQTPIIVLSSRSGESDRVAALDAGADDYVTKPFSPREVAARIRAVLRRLRGSPATRRGERAPLTIDRSRRLAHCADLPLELTRVEFDLLAALLDQPGYVCTRGQLISRVWGDGFAITDRTVDSHIKALRRKLAEAGDQASVIETVRGVGYRVQLSES